MSNVKYTDKSKLPIQINDGDVNNSSTDLSLFGDVRLEYGQELNENLLHLLENFAAPEVTGSTFSNSVPDFTNVTYNTILSRPTGGELWYNTTRGQFYFWNGTQWFPIANRGDYAANWGIISDGYALPKPVSPKTGYVFDYSECIWSVSHANFNGRFDYSICSVGDNGRVTARFRYAGQTNLTSTVANYLIIGIKGNTNIGTNVSPPLPTPTPSPSIGATPTVTPTVSNSATPIIPVTPTVTPTTSAPVTPTVTPTPSVTRSIGSTPQPTPTQTPTRTPTRTPTPSVSRTPNVTVTQTPPPTPTPTRSPVPPMNATFIDGFFSSPTYNQPLYTLSSICDTRLYALIGDNGITCSGIPTTCPTFQCSPEPGGNGNGPHLKITVTGGQGPYTVRFTNWQGSFSTGNQCVILAIGNNSTNLAVPSNSAGNIVAPNTSLTLTRTISSSGGSIEGIYVTGKCSGLDLWGSGTFDVIITDSSPVPLTITRTLNWDLTWFTGA